MDLRWSGYEACVRELDIPTGLWTRQTFNGQGSLWKGRKPANDIHTTTSSELMQIDVDAEDQGKFVVSELWVMSANHVYN